MSAAPWTIRRVDPLDDTVISALAGVLMDCVAGDASVGFLHPLGRDRAAAFWRAVAAGVANGERVLLVGEDADGVCGTVQLVLAAMENQPHRAELAKLLVHRRARYRGMGAALVRAAEEEARARDRTLLVLDTATDAAERLYERLGWRRVGVIPGYALMPGGVPCDTAIYYRDLR